MFIQQLILCPHLRGNVTGAQCRVVNKSIKDMKDVDIKICMSRRHEACSVYFCSLHNDWNHNNRNDESYESVSCA
ncbi:MAG: hypothetical protein ABSB95_15780 [Dissulfurispiraceae bacterium]